MPIVRQSYLISSEFGKGAIFIELHYSHMYSSTLHDPIFPHVQFHWEYALGCIATCTVPATMHDPIFPHVQFQQEYELASHGSCAVDSLSWGGTESWFFLCSLHTAYIHTIELNRGTYPHTLLGKKYQHTVSRILVEINETMTAKKQQIQFRNFLQQNHETLCKA